MSARSTPVSVHQRDSGPIDHRDAIKNGDPLSQLAGLSLDFITKVVQAPMALFLVHGEDEQYRLAEIKAEPILCNDPRELARDYLAAVADDDPILRIADGCKRARILGTSSFGEDERFLNSRLSTEFLADNELGPLIALVMHDRALNQTFLTVLIRGSEETDFSEREKGFLRQAAPFLTQSYHCALGVGGTRGPQIVGNVLSLTPREVEVAQMAAQGSHNQEIAELLHISSGTVKCHIRSIYSKLGVDSRLQLAMAMALLH